MVILPLAFVDLVAKVDARYRAEWVVGVGVGNAIAVQSSSCFSSELEAQCPRWYESSACVAEAEFQNR